jgi:enoyl-CoA hydratase/carnithine racemase
MSDYATIAYDDSTAPIVWITLDQPERRNPISPLTAGELLHACARARDDDAIRAIVLTGAGKVFSAGGDLSALLGKGGAPETVAKPASLVDLLCAMHELGVPIVCAVNGHALAGGMGLMVACDLVVASSAATFGTTEIKVGLWPMMITAEIVRNIGRKKTLELMLTGKRIDAAEAERIGLINEVVEPGALRERASELAGKLAASSPSAIRMGLRAFYKTQDMELRPALEHLEGELARVLATDDAREGLQAFFEKREPKFTGR